MYKYYILSCGSTSGSVTKKRGYAVSKQQDILWGAKAVSKWNDFSDTPFQVYYKLIQ